MSQPRVSAVVVTWNSAADITACLDALVGSEVPGGLEVAVLDNASSDETPALLRAWHEQVDVVLDDRNHGYAEGNVLAARRTGGEYLLLVNPDCTVMPGTIATLVEHLDSEPRCAAASALLLEPDGSPQFFARREPTFLRAIPWFLVLADRRDRSRGGMARIEREYRALLSSPPAVPFAVDVPAAACVLLRRSALPDPFFEAQFPLFFNDVRLYRALRDAGCTVEVVPAARAHHGHGKSHRQLETASKRAEQLLSLRRYARVSWPRMLAWLFDLMLFLDAMGCRWKARRGGADLAPLRVLASGTLGALGLPGGAVPFLSGSPRPMRTRA